jgi:simple sugar transport system substrate-binding protein
MRKSRRCVGVGIGLSAALACLAGCGPAGGNGKHLRFAFITTCVNEDFFKPVKQGMQDAARQMGVECTFEGTPAVDVKAQAEMVRSAVAMGYDGIALNIIDPKAFDEVVREAMDKGIPVVAFNVDDQATPNARLSGVCQDLYKAGRTVGEKAAESIPDGSTVLVTVHDDGISALEDRLRGEQDALKAKNITWKRVVTTSAPEKAAEIIAAALKENPKIKVVLSTGQADTEGAGRAIEKNFAGQGYVSAGFDLSPEILRLIKAGHIRFTIDQQPYVQGYYPVIQLALYCRYGLRPSNMDAGAAVISKSNVDAVVGLNAKGYR